jgi:SAM-dependent methyltransferase
VAAPLPWSQACDNNKGPILSLLREALADRRKVLEIGSGTGQHAAFFAPALAHLEWQPSDLPRNHPGIAAWRAAASAPNLRPPIALDVLERPWPVVQADAVFSANTAHIMPWAAVQAMLEGVASLLPAGGLFLLYGPFRYGEAHTSASNASFDAWLRREDSRMGVRDAHALDRVAIAHGLTLEADHPMPANNRLRAWRRA